MGLSSFIAALRGPRTKGNGPTTTLPNHQRSRSTTRPTAAQTQVEYVRAEAQSFTALPATPPPATLSHDKSGTREARRSRRFSLSRSKSQHDPKHRRSWFGGRPDSDQEVPAVPALVYPGTQESTNDCVQQTPESTRKGSIRRSLSKRRKNTQKEEQSANQGTWFSSNRDTITMQTVPPLPPMPITIDPSKQPVTSTLPMEKRRSRAGSVKSVSSVKTSKSKRKSRSFWSSSNPDDSDSDIPPVPALVRDAPSETASNSSMEYTESRDVSLKPVRTGLKQVRPVSTSTIRAPYRPKSAAKGFLKSTSGASEAARNSYRQSFRLDDDADLVCLTEEQQIEWARLMSCEAKMENRTSHHDTSQAGSIDETCNDNGKYSNAQALAALEFGLRT